jgi:hypothetical protein
MAAIMEKLPNFCFAPGERAKLVGMEVFGGGKTVELNAKQIENVANQARQMLRKRDAEKAAQAPHLQGPATGPLLATASGAGGDGGQASAPPSAPNGAATAQKRHAAREAAEAAAAQLDLPHNKSPRGRQHGA